VAIATTEFLDALGLFAEPIARNFVHVSTLSGRFFTLMVFIHIAVPLILLFILWIHTQRLAHARVNPPRTLAIGTTAMLVGVSLVRPALSQGPADLATVPARVGLDWFYLTIYPLFDRFPLTTIWLAGAAAMALLIVLPWLPPRPERTAARVHLANCNGCTRCFLDCPYSAVTMVPRRDDRPYEQQPVVDPDLCIACGICAGACPTATPYRRRSDLVPGIELPDQPIAALRSAIIETARALRGAQRVLVVGCEFGPELDAVRSASVGTVAVPCLGALPPAFIDYVIARHIVDGILLTGCTPGNCHARLGAEWTVARLAGTRDPCLRSRGFGSRIAICQAGAGGAARLARAIAGLQAAIAQAPAVAARRGTAVPAPVEVTNA
jgi:ferredoxin/coenzyme F420-reducing hydrogenase delta subunit